MDIIIYMQQSQQPCTAWDQNPQPPISKDSTKYIFFDM